MLKDGFLLEGEVGPESVDAVFLDLPKPELAVKHAYQVLKKKGKLCNFSPCIEQVQKASMEMAKLGFYDIRTFECLNKELETTSFQYNSIYDDQRGGKKEEGARPFKNIKGKDKEKNKRKVKVFDK